MKKLLNPLFGSASQQSGSIQLELLFGKRIFMIYEQVFEMLGFLVKLFASLTLACLILRVVLVIGLSTLEFYMATRP